MRCYYLLKITYNFFLIVKDLMKSKIYVIFGKIFYSMNKSFLLLTIVFLFSSCSSKKNIVYLNKKDSQKSWSINKNNLISENIQSGDILDIKVLSLIPEAALIYNKVSNDKASSVEIMSLEGYLVNDSNQINFPILGYISTNNLNLDELQKKITNILVTDGHLSDPSVIIRRLNAKFTILGEVRNPGTYNYFDQKLNLFQALGYAGDLNIGANRKNILLVRQHNGIVKFHKLSLLEENLVNSPFFIIRNNDVLVVNPNFSKVKSAGFIGSPSSIASIASLALSITLLLINN